MPLPPEEIAQLMRFVAKKTKNVKSPMNVAELCRQFKEETGTLVSAENLKQRVYMNRHKIHEMNEFDMDTKVKMLFGLRAPVNPKFLIEIMKHAEVEVNDQRRIIKYRKKDGGIELSANHMRLSDYEGEQRDKTIRQFLYEKTKTVDTPMADIVFVKEFKNITGCLDSISSLKQRYRRVRNTIFELPMIDKNTKIKMMFISNANLSEDILEELRKDAVVKVDEERKITKYKANDGSLELEVDRSAKIKSAWANKKKKKKNSKVINASSDSEDSKSIISQSLAAIPKGRKRARQVSEDEESLKLEDDSETNFDTNNANDFDYDPPIYELDMDDLPIEKKPESLIEVKTEESSSTIVGNYYEDNFFEYDLLNDVDVMEHIPEEKKPESFTEVKSELPEEPSTSNFEYHYEENFDHILMEPKPEFFE